MKGKKKPKGNAYFTQWGQFSCFYCRWIPKWQKLRHKTIEDALLGWLFTLGSSLNWDARCYKTWSLPSPKQLSTTIIHLLLQNCLEVSQGIQGPVIPRAIRQSLSWRSCQTEQKVPPRQDGELGADRRTLSRFCQVVCWADHPDFRSCLRSVELIAYRRCPNRSLLRSVKAMTNFYVAEGRWDESFPKWRTRYHTGNLSRTEHGGFSSLGLPPIPQKYLSSPAHERLICHQSLP